MSLREQVLADIKTAMKAKEAEKLSAIRMLQAAIKNREIELRPNEITESEILSVVKKMTKQRKDSITEFEKAGRQDLVDKEKFELGVIEKYMPAQMSLEDVTRHVEEAIKSLAATTQKQMGAVIKEVMAKTEGLADGKVISDLVRSKLS